LSHLVRPWNAPPKSGTAVLCHDLDELSEVVAELQSTTTGIPVLLRQYLRLGGRLLGFSVDRHFSNVLDGLIVVDLTKTEPTLLSRYLGKAQAAAFLDYHHTR
jgi:putative hemolysin